MSLSKLPLLAGLLSASVLGAACSGGGSGPDFGAPSTSYPAPHPSMAQLVKAPGGSVQTAPRLISITYSGDTLAPQLHDFVAKLKGSSYWTTTTSEYGVGPIASTTAESLAFSAPQSLTTSDVETNLLSWINGGLVPAPDLNTTYVVFFPSGTTINDPGLGPSCANYGGYHSVTQNGGKPIAYAVLPECSPGAGSGLTVLDLTTFAASHEAVEAATDPFGNGYRGADTNNGIWDLVSFGMETGDYCEYQPGVLIRPADIGYAVQATWSNAAAAAGHDPCVPRSGPYFNAAPELSDVTDVPIGNGFVEQSHAVRLPVGSTTSVTLDLYSDADTGGPFDLKVVDYATLAGRSAEVVTQLDRTSGVNGEKVHLSMRRASAGTLFSGGSVVFIIAHQGTSVINLWPIWVNNS